MRGKSEDSCHSFRGFREVGENGKELEKALLETVRKTSIRTVGPNCQGMNTPKSVLCATLACFTRRPRPIAVVAQSGTIARSKIKPIVALKVKL